MCVGKEKSVKHKMLCVFFILLSTPATHSIFNSFYFTVNLLFLSIYMSFMIGSDVVDL